MRLRSLFLAACFAAVTATFHSGADASVNVDATEESLLSAPLAPLPFNIPESAVASLTFKERWNEFASLGRPADPFQVELPNLTQPLEADPWSSKERVETQPTPELSVPLPRAKPSELSSIDRKALSPEFDDGGSRLEFGAPVLAPFAHTRFCLKNPDDCRTTGEADAFDLTRSRAEELRQVNLQVNRAIRPQHMDETPATEKWEIGPAVGDCNDYAVTKRHDLLARGWPSGSLLLAEVITGWGEHHLVLVVRTKQGDYVADSLASRIRPWSETGYEWVRVQLPRNPNLWASVRSVPSESLVGARAIRKRAS
jgi:predicted transglutaminase-like cysteine proteinase